LDFIKKGKILTPPFIEGVLKKMSKYITLVDLQGRDWPVSRGVCPGDF
jgi:hypothetical protein